MIRPMTTLADPARVARPQPGVHDAAASCPLCGAAPEPPAISVAPVPAHSVVLHHDRGEALATATGRIALAACAGCGFVYNTGFDPGAMDYGRDYEATQAFSASFNAFHRKLAVEIAAAAAHGSGPVVEIGCGQGEFLALLEAEGCAAPIGFDPAFDPARSALPAGSSARIVATDFPEEPDLPAVAAVVCKMTLEHIAAPVDLLRRMAVLSRANGECPVFVLVPNATDIFRRGAFWDIYHEHCNYFTEATLAQAMGRAGLEVTQSAEVYGGQYLKVMARAAADPAAVPPVGPATLEAELRAFRAFAGEIATLRARWSERLAAAERRGERLILWGAGSKAVAFLGFTGAGPTVVGAIDINPRKQGTFLPASGVEVLAPETAVALSPDRIILMNGTYLGEVALHCARVGLEAPIDCLDTPPLPDGATTRVCIGVATRGRPRMLSALLDSLRGLAVPEGVALVLVVVENGEAFTLEAQQAAMRDWGPTVFAVEPALGIPHARNAVLEISLRLECDHTAFIDDDEVAEPDWIAALLEEARRGDLDLVGGPVALLPVDAGASRAERIVLRGIAARLARNRQMARKLSAAGRAGKITVVTNNWLVRNDFLRRTGLRFDPGYAVSGGSDTAFFHDAKALGARTGWSDRALVHEALPPARRTLGYQFHRAKAQSMTAFRRKYADRRSALQLGQSYAFVGYKLVTSVVLVICAPLTGGRSLVTAARAAGVAIGRMQAIRGANSTLYSDIQGD
jgi:glycosyltransferase involved in cell wall biosynthesis